MRVRPVTFRLPQCWLLLGLLFSLAACGSPAAPAAQPTPPVASPAATPMAAATSSPPTTMPAATSATTDTSPAPAATSTPAASQPSDEIAYVKDGNIWLLDLATSETRQLTTEGHDSSPAWSPDGQTLAFVRLYDKNPEIVTLRMDGSDVTRVTNTPAGELTVAYSRDGALFFTRQGQGEESEIEVVKHDPAGAEAVVYSQPGGLCHPVHLSMGSETQLALSINCGRGYNAFFIDLAANKTTDISLEYAPTSCVYQATWAHRQPRLAVITALDCSPQLNAGISALNLAGAQPQMEEVFTNREIVALDWSPDDQALVFAKQGMEQDLAGLWVVPTTGAREPRQVLKEGAEPAWRPGQK